jgi:hypothetical protein
MAPSEAKEARMSMQKVRYQDRNGAERVYEYAPRSYYVTAEVLALKALKKRPLRLVKVGLVNGARWTAGQRGPVFNDATIVKLIEKGLVVCLGEFVELRGVER